MKKMEKYCRSCISLSSTTSCTKYVQVIRLSFVYHVRLLILFVSS